MMKEFRKGARRLLEAKKVHIVSHIDADGITSGSIASIFLDRNGIEYDIEFAKKLDEKTIERLRRERHELIWFTDLGSGYAGLLTDMPVVITDHHEPAKIPPVKKEGGRTRLNVVEDLTHLNAHLFGMDGAKEISGSGMTYLLATAHDSGNRNLAGLAVIGALGDMQDNNAERRLIGKNVDIVKDGLDAGVISVINDMRAFGREARDIIKFLSFANEPEIPGLSGNRSAVIEFLKNLGIDMMSGEKYRRWCDLTYGEKKEIIRAIKMLIIQNGGGEEKAESLMGEVYVINGEEIGSSLHDGKEFATLLNSCGKYGKAEIGFRVCRGDRRKYFKEALGFLRDHRANLVGAMRMLQDRPITEYGSLQYFHAGNEISEEVVGTVAGMLLGSGSVKKTLPIVAFVNTEDGKIKVSTRGTKEMVDSGLNLSQALSEACAEVGGAGGGHDRAAGGTIDAGKEEDFLRTLNRIIKKQMNQD